MNPVDELDLDHLSGDDLAYVDGLYQDWLQDPSSVPDDWRSLFDGQARPDRSTKAPGPDQRSLFESGTGGISAKQALLLSRVPQLINAYRVRGHSRASLDPLQLVQRSAHPELELSYHGLSQELLDEEVEISPLMGLAERATLREIIAHLNRCYCQTLGVEYMNLISSEEKRWVQEQLEIPERHPPMSTDQHLHILRKVADAETLERTIHTRFPGTKRFSLEGGEGLIPLLDLLIREAAERGVRETVLGMAHRGRLNVLCNTLKKSPLRIINEFQDVSQDSVMGSGDVKYHLGYSSDVTTESGKNIHLSLVFNPSHLEAVNPVVLGRVRAKVDRDVSQGGARTGSCMPLLVHGDAAFAGQGVVAEILNLSDLNGYSTEGTIHVIVNNQIGFTTSVCEARSTPYCTDVARMLAVPILHVNGEDMEAVAKAARIAVAWRQRFQRDIVIDMYCYRRHGHNEGDDPSFTQPLMYKAIHQHGTLLQLYSEDLVRRGLATQEQVDGVLAASKESYRLALEQESAPASGIRGKNSLQELWKVWGRADGVTASTGVEADRLRELIQRANTPPERHSTHTKHKRILKRRLQMASGELPVNWAVAEQMAFATLVTEGFSVRLSGQDCQRGTFSHRHAVLKDCVTGESYFPLANLSEDQGLFQVHDSLLSEVAVLGFEFGYSLDCPDGLNMWEAQFGDFSNGAQVIIDQFIVASEQKWNRLSGLVMLLPHGYEGQGPEHSSARLERYLMLCAEENIIVANCTTPANYFHLLRRQVLQKGRKPLVHMAPKSLLRHPACVSTLEDLGGSFQAVLGDPSVGEEARRLVLCSGKIYYDLLAEREKRGIDDIALVRVEQLYPLPWEEIERELLSRPMAEIVWCQEEPRNMGTWPVYCDWLRERFPEKRKLGYVGRKPAASPATGSNAKHQAEQRGLISAALTL